ncbi:MULTISPECIES: bifunctional riboflavin kinase/FAD synthetase [unclassified Microbacterium]|uniref:bifunctional riboflavin kinase/FAD synthetase n=1 Tax=unclassified Microbacterium TaxID=2609290 RepID=UPI000CFC28C0|nr:MULTISPECIES: bifunctional riboflavin kinase/FAD synthetase [unclassified Microbacterium]PQZ61315.1 bifunctional riboflavin kinase/FMN adenylyltransferase [Microbacterium sp. MYb43]PQZ82526.1 bifunctional riboflavin kinase/FMN adenylyltransferase [Microbacterium sp. MYb40]PRB23774.1 bifunctional riboflavin kinase/FMN adenylyltransferase [Microbacterium sp. MYb54]PRB29669.1 bifunctional riboflavin kinase/FMN adenylyltransferase [Microbacterium sp. MYb50]PRB70973.1 bifunctional riboflavin kin
MIVFRSPEEVPGDFGPTAVAIGKFDGVHAGHRAVIERLRQAATATGSRSVAVTFDRNPLAVIRPDRCPENVVTVDRKLELLGELGLDATLVLTFDEELAARSAEDFVVDILVGALQVSTVLVGEDFRFGHRGAGTPELLRELAPRYGFSVEVVDEVYLPGSTRRVSSSWIRELLMEGDVAAAAKALGRLPDVRGEVVHGLKRGRELGFPTANLSTIVDAFVPADGVYAGWLVDHDTGIRHPSAISVGTNPTFDDVLVRQVEAHVLGETGLDLYGHDVTVEFVERLRGMVAFEGIDKLMVQMGADVTDAARALGLPS